MNTQKLTIYLTQTKSQKVGTLAIKDRKIYFEYDHDFLKTGIEISPYKLPLKAGLHVCEDDVFDGLWGVFADSLPDGWGRLLMDRYLAKLGINVMGLSPLDRLAYIGKYAMGALSYEPTTHKNESITEEIILDELALHAQNILKGSSEELVDKLLALNGSSGGARPKVLIQLSHNMKDIIHGRQTLKKGYSHWMVKFASSLDSQEIGAIEYAYSLMAKDAGLDMPLTTLLKGNNGSYFACERFDRRGDERVHMHTVAGLTHSDFRLPTLDYDDLLSLTLHLTKDIQEVEKLFRLACFNLFTHNRDDHAKNFSFTMNRQGIWHLSPMYDITFSSGPAGEHSTMYLGEGKNPNKTHLQKLAKKHGLKNGAVIMEEVTQSVSRWYDFADKATVSKKSQTQIGRVIKEKTAS